MKSTVSKHLIKNIPINIGSQKNPRFCYENIVTIIIFLSGAILIALYGYKYANNLSCYGTRLLIHSGDNITDPLTPKKLNH